jgi:aspartyl-tRNA(Asn)/glutamyl-tRNA(Gln) amidotransferase subunit C
MSLDAATVRRIADLARIRVPDDQLDAMGRELSSILGWIAQLNEVDTSGVAPMTGVGDFALPMRDDLVTDGGDAARVLANAPDRAENFFAVPKVVE